MNSYKIYLTKSCEVAGVLASGFCAGDTGIVRVRHGAVHGGDEYVPAVYQDEGYFSCVVEYTTPEGKQPKYELIIA